MPEAARKRIKTDREFYLEDLIHQRQILVAILLRGIHSGGMQEAREAVREDNRVRRLIHEYTKLTADLDREFNQAVRQE